MPSLAKPYINVARTPVQLIQEARGLQPQTKRYQEIKTQFNKICMKNQEGDVPWLDVIKSIEPGLIDTALQLVDDITVCNEDHENCLHAIMRRPRIGSRDDTILAFVKKIVAKNDLLIHMPNTKGETPLWLAVQRNLVDVVDYLLQQGANPNQKNAQGASLKNICYRSPALKDLLDGKIRAIAAEKKQAIREQQMAEQRLDQTTPYWLHDGNPQIHYLKVYSALTDINKVLQAQQQPVPQVIQDFTARLGNEQATGAALSPAELDTLYQQKRPVISQYFSEHLDIVFSNMVAKHCPSNMQPSRERVRKCIKDYQILIDNAESIAALEKIFDKIEQRSHPVNANYLRSNSTRLARWRRVVERAEHYDDTGTTNAIHGLLKKRAAQLIQEKHDVPAHLDKYTKILSKHRPTALTFLTKWFNIAPSHVKLLEPYQKQDVAEPTKCLI